MATESDVRFFAPISFRVGAVVAFLGASAGAVTTAIGGAREGLGLESALGLVMVGVFALFAGWMAYSLCFLPVVRITTTEVVFHGIGTFAARRTALADIVGLRVQDALDLRLRERSGTEHSLMLSQIAREDRPRLESVLKERIAAPK